MFTYMYLTPMVISMFIVVVDIILERRWMHWTAVSVTRLDMLLIFCPVFNWVYPVLSVWMLLEWATTKVKATRAAWVARKISSFE